MIPKCRDTRRARKMHLTAGRFEAALNSQKIPMRFLQKPTCTTCRKAKAFLEDWGAELEPRSLDTQRLGEARFHELIGDRDYKKFLNTRNELYRSRKMKGHPPSRAAAIQWMAKEPNLIRRPVMVRGSEIVLGHHEEAFRKLVKREAR